jgi:hypothetical protein
MNKDESPIAVPGDDNEPHLLGPNGQPLQGPSPREKEELVKLNALMQEPTFHELVGKMLIVWRLFAVVRAELFKASDGKLTQEQFGVLMQALLPQAMQPFKLIELNKALVEDILVYLRRLRKKLEVSGEYTPGGDKPPIPPVGGS